ncbi:MAG: D-alanyl-D-alanine carboxypeptidase/D-alanyl-D-alanine-endopeptidase [Bdellovibrionaceae bacterium]|nr:D-alanyl-D-alanine carboxypeptidase/D-alanyl-D-alanine-endopeptidase [Pseudobdellovibrionaceae bacterium]NUM58846.1 D-alanyl-D-alanine carboxypeptidase/D-alanyl-D-alanine-endopeptidase [Pseudobdellovibrionaceae bacterium]
MKTILLILTLVQMGLAFEANKTEKIKDYLHKQKISNQEIGLIITKGENKIIFELNSDKIMIPASISKLITSAAVLENVSSGYKFKTQLLLDKNYKIEGGIYKGTLYLKGGGDPSFVSENLWYLVNVFSRLKIQKIEGDIVVDDSLFDKVRFDESRQDVRVDRAYDAPVGAMSFNWNSVNIYVRPGDLGKKTLVFIDPAVELFEVENKSSTVSGAANNISIEKKGNVVSVHGSLGKDLKEVAIYKNISDPDIWSAENLKLFLTQRNIQVTGKVINRKTPSEAQVVAEYESKPIEHILADMNKFSNNYVAEMLTKNLSLQKNSIGSLTEGVKIINEFLKKLNLDKNSYEFYNPSGLTRDNKISAKSMVKILNYVHADFTIFPEFLISLPIAGVDGTLKKRMKGQPTERWVRAKTGYLTGVVSLAGYAGLRDGEICQFAFIFNGKTDESKIKNIFDNILKILLE